MVNTVEQALEFAQRESASRSQDWTGYCQMFVRKAYGIGPGSASAWAQWLALDDDERHSADEKGGLPADAPLGAALFFKGSSPFGHVALKKRDQDGRLFMWSNDLRRVGQIDAVSVNAPYRQWGQTYLGWGETLNNADLPLEVRRRKPRERPYDGIGEAVARLEGARETARRQKDWEDFRLLVEEIGHLRRLDASLRFQRGMRR